MTHLRPLVVGLAALAALSFTGCSGDTSRELGYKDVEIQEYQRQIKELEDQLYKKDAQSVKAALPAGDTKLSDVQKAVGPDVTVTGQPLEIHLSIESSILFKSGSAVLSSQAKSALNKVVATIGEKFPNHEIRVIGHTDDEKITRAKNTWQDNWDLSTGRAREVLLYLEGRGIAAKRLGLGGFGPERPLLPNTSSDNRQKNRRVEIVVIPPAK